MIKQTEDTRSWMSESKLTLNDRKTEFMMIGNKASLHELPIGKTITIGGECIVAAEVAKNIGVVF